MIWLYPVTDGAPDIVRCSAEPAGTETGARGSITGQPSAPRCCCLTCTRTQPSTPHQALMGCLCQWTPESHRNILRCGLFENHWQGLTRSSIHINTLNCLLSLV